MIFHNITVCVFDQIQQPQKIVPTLNFWTVLFIQYKYALNFHYRKQEEKSDKFIEVRCVYELYITRVLIRHILSQFHTQ